MAQQSFFHETPHVNLGLMFKADDIEFGNAECILDDLKAKAKLIDEGNGNIFRVIAQSSSAGDGVQIFLAPYTHYKEIAEKLLERYEYSHRAYITDKHGVKRFICKASFKERMDQIITRYSSNRKTAVNKTIELLKSHYEKDILALTNKIEIIAREYRMGVVKHQSYYAGLAETWIEYDDVKKVA